MTSETPIPIPETPPTEEQHHIAILTSEAGNAFVLHAQEVTTDVREDGTHVRQLGRRYFGPALIEETSPTGERSYTYDFPQFWETGESTKNGVPLTVTDKWVEGGSSVSRDYNTGNPRSISDFETHYPPLIGTWKSINTNFRGTQDESRIFPESQQRRPSLVSRVKRQLGRWSTRAS
jgi:hypothetical protein